MKFMTDMKTLPCLPNAFFTVHKLVIHKEMYIYMKKIFLVVKFQNVKGNV